METTTDRFAPNSCENTHTYARMHPRKHALLNYYKVTKSHMLCASFVPTIPVDVTPSSSKTENPARRYDGTSKEKFTFGAKKSAPSPPAPPRGSRAL